MPANDSARGSAILSRDTSAAIEQRQIDAWRRQSPLEKLQLVSEATHAVLTLSLAGIRRRYPAASDRECFLRLACIMHGAEVVRAIFPDAAHVIDHDQR